MRFIVDDPHDSIQECWVKNCFYEEEQLIAMSGYIKPNSLIVDVGANVGNHAMWFDKNVSPSKVVVFEPHPKAISIMLQNSAINHCHSICFDYVGYALGKESGKCIVEEIQIHNLGGTRLKKHNNGFIEVISGDSVFKDKDVDFIKIDVEGMEIDVLLGFKDTIDRCKPVIFIEIDNANDDIFKSIIYDLNYHIVNEFVNYPTCKNYLIKFNNS